jgi:hypothetical protein
MYVNTTLFTLLHSYEFQPSRSHPQESTDSFREQFKQNTRPDRCKYQIKEQRVVCYVTVVTFGGSCLGKPW